MGGGKHRRQNPRGSQGGRKLPGDVLAEQVHGRKGMYVERREKGESHVHLLAEKSALELALNKNESQVVFFLHIKGIYCPRSLTWEDLVRELHLIRAAKDDLEADDFMRSLSDKTRGWVTYLSYHSVCLNGSHRNEISVFITKCLQTMKGS